MSTEDISPSEEVLWEGARSHWYYLGSWFLTLVLVAASVAGIYWFRDDLAPWMPWAYAAPAVLLLIAVAAIIWIRGERRYEVTNHRVVIESGRIVKNSNEIRVQDIRSINVAKHGLLGFFGIGTVEFSSAATDDAEVIFVGIANADQVRDLVRKLQNRPDDSSSA